MSCIWSRSSQRSSPLKEQAQRRVETFECLFWLGVVTIGDCGEFERDVTVTVPFEVPVVE